MHGFLLISVFFAFPLLITTDKSTMINLIMNIINEERRSFAQKFQVANMNELEYDPAMTAYANSLIKKCWPKPFLIAQKHYEIIPMTYGRIDSMEKMISEFRAIAKTYFINPVQTKFGLSTDPHPVCHYQFWVIPRVELAYDYNLIFVMGPYKEYHVKTGVPGSACGDVGRMAVDGLCVKNPWDQRRKLFSIY